LLPLLKKKKTRKMPEPITKCPVKKDIVLRQRRLPFHVILYNPRGPQVHYYPIPETKFHLVDENFHPTLTLQLPSSKRRMVNHISRRDK
jgi:hypothetical protein